MAAKTKIQDIARQELEGELLTGFEAFLDFLKEEKINTVSSGRTTAIGLKMTYKGKGVGSMTLGIGQVVGVFTPENNVRIDVDTASADYDDYLEGQVNEVVALFMEQMNCKCVHCYPTRKCSSNSGRTFNVSGKKYENVCCAANWFKFDKHGGDMHTVTMCRPCGVYPPVSGRPVPIETVKKVIIARKEYIEKILTKY